MQKVDLKKELKSLYNPSVKEVAGVEVPAFNFLMIDGKGDPNTALEYQEAIQALYTISYGLKFAVKKAQAIDYVVMPLEGLWWTEDMSLFSQEDKSNWKWTAMILQPQYVERSLFANVLEEVKKKKALPGLAKARFENFREGQAAQIMHIGPFAAEGPTIAKVHEFIKSHGGRFDGARLKHHEIYLSDFRKTAPDRLKTVVRQPFTS